MVVGDRRNMKKITQYTVPGKSKLTVPRYSNPSTRSSILEYRVSSRELRVSSREHRVSSRELQVSRLETKSLVALD